MPRLPTIPKLTTSFCRSRQRKVAQLHASDFYAVVWDDRVFCTDCLPDDVSFNDPEVSPIFASEEFDTYPVCDVCGEVQDYVNLTDVGRATMGGKLPAAIWRNRGLWTDSIEVPTDEGGGRYIRWDHNDLARYPGGAVREVKETFILFSQQTDTALAVPLDAEIEVYTRAKGDKEWALLKVEYESEGSMPYQETWIERAAARECPRCHKRNAIIKEEHPDTDMNEIVLQCPDCGYSSG